jgi:hypothetical protein
MGLLERGIMVIQIMGPLPNGKIYHLIESYLLET